METVKRKRMVDPVMKKRKVDQARELRIFIFSIEQTGDFNLVSFDPHDDPDEYPTHGTDIPDPDEYPTHETVPKFIDETSMIKQDMPTDLRQLKYYQFAALGSMLYFIGGVRSDGDTSDKVFAFDTAHKEWETEVPCMKLKRAFSTVVTYENKIYVFGYDHYYLKGNTPLPQHWAEFFDPQAKTWNYLPALAPQELRAGFKDLVATVLEDQNKILLCIRNFDVYSYSFATESWCHENYSAFTDYGVRWSNTVAVVDDTLFWNYFGNILAFDFQPEALAAELKCSIPNAIETFGTPSVLDGFPGISFLVYAGNGKLCLVYGNQHDDDDDLIRCHTFQLRHSHAKKQSELCYKGCATYETNPPSHPVFAMAMMRLI